MSSCVCELFLQLFDIDEDNCITQDEFSCLIRSALGVCDLDVNSLFTEIDADGSGHITYGLYSNYYSEIRLSGILEMLSFREYYFIFIFSNMNCMKFSKQNNTPFIIALVTKGSVGCQAIYIFGYIFCGKMFFNMPFSILIIMFCT